MKDNVKRFLDKDCIIIFDTNVYLNLYEYSPDIADFLINIIELVDSKIYLPNTVKREFHKNHNHCQGRQKKKFQNVPKMLKKHSEKAKIGILNQLIILEKFKFPGIDALKCLCTEKILEIDQAFDKYVEEQDVFQKINMKFLDADRILGIINKINNTDRLLEEFTIDELYSICEEGKNRYSKSIPPGFEDAKTKDGIEKYNDLIIWKEALKLCKTKNKDLIFVTDDIKNDWWIKEINKKDIFHVDLVKEFNDNTGKDILGVTSYELFTIIAGLFSIEIPQTIERVLRFSTGDYLENILAESDFKDELAAELEYSDELYVDTDTLSNYDGSYLQISDCIDDIEILRHEFEGYENNNAVYRVILNIQTSAISKWYCGKDEDTKEIYLSDSYYVHTLEGEIEVKITRDAEDYYLEDLLNDNSYAKLDIISCKLVETDSYYFNVDDLCIECGINIGEVMHKSGGMVCHNCAVGDENGEICPSCGEKVPQEMMAGNGFCIECTQDSDYL